MKKTLKVLVLTFVSKPIEGELDLEAALQSEDWHTEADVLKALKDLGHEVCLGVIFDNIDTIRQYLETHQPDIVFNLVDEFQKKSTNDYKIASYYELRGVPYTGCGPQGLMLAKDKGLAKMVLRHHRIKVADSVTCPPGRKIRRPSRLRLPVIVKTLYEEGSVGISQASIVRDDEQFRERVEFIHRTFNQPALAEEFVEGRELYAALLGNDRYQVLPLRELRFGDESSDAPQIASYKVKWDWAYRDRWKITNDFATDLPEETLRRISNLCRRAARALKMDGYARMDLRLTPDGLAYLLEANPNPFLAWGEDFAESAEAAGLSFAQLVERILRLGLQRAAKS